MSERGRKEPGVVTPIEARLRVLEYRTSRSSAMAINAFVKSLRALEYHEVRKAPMWLNMIVGILPLLAILLVSIYGIWWPLVGWVAVVQTLSVMDLAMRPTHAEWISSRRAEIDRIRVRPSRPSVQDDDV